MEGEKTERDRETRRERARDRDRESESESESERERESSRLVIDVLVCLGCEARVVVRLPIAPAHGVVRLHAEEAQDHLAGA